MRVFHMKELGGVVEISQRGVKKNSCIEKKSLWVRLRVNLLELRHRVVLVQQVDEVCVAQVLALVGVVGGGCGEKHRRGACRHGEGLNQRSAMFPYQSLSTSSLDEADKVEAKTPKTEVDYRRSQSDLECHCVERVHEKTSRNHHCLDSIVGIEGFYVFESWALKSLEEVCKGASIVISSAKEACKRLPWKKLVFVLKVVCCSLFVHELLKLVVLTLLGALKVFIIVITGKFQESHYLTPKWNRPKAKYWQVRTWMDTSHIVHMNSLLKSRHVSRIRETPFKCCLGIVEPIQLNLKLLKQLHQSFRVRQQLVSFDVVDVVMTLGLGVGGLEISFDESIVGKVGELLNSSETKAKELVNMFDNIVGDDDLDVDVVCRLNSRHVSNMPCVVLDDLDSLCNYDWSSAIHTYLVHRLNRCNKKLLTGKIVDSVSISGSAVVLQVWVYERLGLHSDPSCRVFPRLMRFCSLSYGTEEIDLLFRQGEVHFEWYIRSVERQDPIIRRAFNMDALARTAEEPEKGENSCQPPRAGRLEKVRKNNQKIRSLKDEIVGIRKALIERRKRKRFYQNISVDEAGVDVVGEGNEGGLEEATVDDTVADGAGVDEGVVVEKAFAETTGHEQETTAAPIDEGVADEAAFGETAAHEEETTAAPVDKGVVDEAAFGETAAHEEETTAAPVDEDGATAAAVDGCAASAAAVDGSAASEAAVDGSAATTAPVDEAAAPAAPVDEAAAPAAAVDEARAIEEPVHEADEDVVDELPPRDPSAFVDIGGDDDDADQLIPVVQPLVVEPLSTIPADLIATVDLDKLYHYVCEIMGQLLTTRDCSSLGPRECVDNMTHLLTDNKRRVAKRQVWQLIDYQAYFRQDLVRLHDLLSADWVFIPVVTKNHWWCYALRPCTMQFFVIDSLDKGISGRGSIDRSIVRFTVEVQLSLMKLLAKNIQRFWGILSNSFDDSKIPFNVEQAKIPVQPNTFDCGLIMMKVMEIWDGEDKYDGKTRPAYSNEELTAFRRKYICDWILDGENIRILGVLQHYGLVLSGFQNAAPKWVLGAKMDEITGVVSLPQANRLCNRLLRPCKRLPGEYMGYVLNVGRVKVKLCSSIAVSFPQQNRYCNRLLRPCKRLPGTKMDAITGSLNHVSDYQLLPGFLNAAPNWVLGTKTDGVRWQEYNDYQVLPGFLNAAPIWVLRAKMDAITGAVSLPQAKRLCNHLLRPCKRLPGEYMGYGLNVGHVSDYQALTGFLNAAPYWVLKTKMDAITGSLSTSVDLFQVLCHFLKQIDHVSEYQVLPGFLNAAPSWVLGTKLDGVRWQEYNAVSLPQANRLCNRLLRPCKRLPGEYMGYVLNVGSWRLRWMELGGKSTNHVSDYQVLTGFLNAAPNWVLGTKMDAITGSLSTSVDSFQVLCHFLKQIDHVSDYQVPPGFLNVAPSWVFRTRMDGLCSSIAVSFPQQNRYCNRLLRPCKRLPGAHWFFKRCSQLGVGDEDRCNYRVPDAVSHPEANRLCNRLLRPCKRLPGESTWVARVQVKLCSSIAVSFRQQNRYCNRLLRPCKRLPDGCNYRIPEYKCSLISSAVSLPQANRLCNRLLRPCKRLPGEYMGYVVNVGRVQVKLCSSIAVSFPQQNRYCNRLLRPCKRLPGSLSTSVVSLPQENRLCNRLLRPCKRLPGEYMGYVLNVGRVQVKLCSSIAVSFPQQNRYCNRLLRPCKRLPDHVSDYQVLTGFLNAAPNWVLGTKIDAITGSLSTSVMSLPQVLPGFLNAAPSWVFRTRMDGVNHVSDYQVLTGFLNAAPNWVLGTKMDAITGAVSLPQANRLCNRLLRPCKRLPGENMGYVLNVVQVKLCCSIAVSFPQQNRYSNRLLRPCKRLPGEKLDSVLKLVSVVSLPQANRLCNRLLRPCKRLPGEYMGYVLNVGRVQVKLCSSIAVSFPQQNRYCNRLLRPCKRLPDHVSDYQVLPGFLNAALIWVLGTKMDAITGAVSLPQANRLCNRLLRPCKRLRGEYMGYVLNVGSWVLGTKMDGVRWQEYKLSYALQLLCHFHNKIDHVSDYQVLPGFLNATPNWVLGTKMDAITGSLNHVSDYQVLPGFLNAALIWVFGTKMDGVRWQEYNDYQVLTGFLNAAPKWVLGTKMDAITGAVSLPQANRLCNRLLRPCKRLPGEYMGYVLNVGRVQVKLCSSIAVSFPQQNRYCNRLLRPCKRLPGEYMGYVLNVGSAVSLPQANRLCNRLLRPCKRLRGEYMGYVLNVGRVQVKLCSSIAVSFPQQNRYCNRLLRPCKRLPGEKLDSVLKLVSAVSLPQANRLYNRLLRLCKRLPGEYMGYVLNVGRVQVKLCSSIAVSFPQQNRYCNRLLRPCKRLPDRCNYRVPDAVSLPQANRLCNRLVRPCKRLPGEYMGYVLNVGRVQVKLCSSIAVSFPQQNRYCNRLLRPCKRLPDGWSKVARVQVKLCSSIVVSFPQQNRYSNRLLRPCKRLPDGCNYRVPDAVSLPQANRLCNRLLRPCKRLRGEYMGYVLNVGRVQVKLCSSIAVSFPQQNRYCNRLLRPCKRLPDHVSDYQVLPGFLNAALIWVLGTKMDGVRWQEYNDYQVLTGFLNAAPRWVLGTKMDAITGAVSLPQANRLCNRLLRPCKRLPGEYMGYVLNVGRVQVKLCSSIAVSFPQLNRYCNRLLRPCKRLPGEYMGYVLNVGSAVSLPQANRLCNRLLRPCKRLRGEYMGYVLNVGRVQVKLCSSIAVSFPQQNRYCNRLLRPCKRLPGEKLDSVLKLVSAVSLPQANRLCNRLLRPCKRLPGEYMGYVLNVGRVQVKLCSSIAVSFPQQNRYCNRLLRPCNRLPDHVSDYQVARVQVKLCSSIAVSFPQQNRYCNRLLRPCKRLPVLPGFLNAAPNWVLGTKMDAITGSLNHVSDYQELPGFLNAALIWVLGTKMDGVRWQEYNDVSLPQANRLCNRLLRPCKRLPGEYMGYVLNVGRVQVKLCSLIAVSFPQQNRYCNRLLRPCKRLPDGCNYRVPEYKC
ncbi:hypothetical protein V8G54_003701 [Vigna mungo]|uniref:Ubiquitin-like protease family profile domain-containing protein n=1 Tax=Vigna mungo TaxID=3915 RepID=A0AAQ3SC01_VIGMU